MTMWVDVLIQTSENFRVRPDMTFSAGIHYWRVPIMWVGFRGNVVWFLLSHANKGDILDRTGNKNHC